MSYKSVKLGDKVLLFEEVLSLEPTSTPKIRDESSVIVWKTTEGVAYSPYGRPTSRVSTGTMKRTISINATPRRA